MARGYYSTKTTSDLETWAANLQGSVAAEFPGGSAADWEAHTGRLQENARRLQAIQDELSFRARNPGQFEREAALRAYTDGWFGIVRKKVA